MEKKEKEVASQKPIRLNVNKLSVVTINFSDKSFRMAGKTLEDAIEYYLSKKMPWKVEAISSRTMEEEIPKKIYTPEECKQLLENIKVAIKEKIAEFTDNSNISIKGIKYNDIHMFIDITEL